MGMVIVERLLVAHSAHKTPSDVRLGGVVLACHYWSPDTTGGSGYYCPRYLEFISPPPLCVASYETWRMHLCTVQCALLEVIVLRRYPRSQFSINRLSPVERGALSPNFNIEKYSSTYNVHKFTTSACQHLRNEECSECLLCCLVNQLTSSTYNVRKFTTSACQHLRNEECSECLLCCLVDQVSEQCPLVHYHFLLKIEQCMFVGALRFTTVVRQH
ncbi:hypothetical protein J6590_038552 [Homalodisca vitripennis]|nr:hypothetical protein J6590_038552 [Homalodisca vitripennis]